MTWTPVPFGKYKGKTLPQIVLTDPDWFFWAVENHAFQTGSLPDEAAEIHRKATTIKVPDQTPTAKQVEYVIHPDVGKLALVQVVLASTPPHVGASKTHRRNYFDLSMPRRIASYDKFGAKQVVNAIKIYVFQNKNIRLSKTLCESFFDDDTNFA